MDSPSWVQGLYHKAEALYQMGDFEYALMFYHRGNKIRPDLQEFQLGIHKAQEAINNSIGSEWKGEVNHSKSAITFILSSTPALQAQEDW